MHHGEQVVDAYPCLWWAAGQRLGDRDGVEVQFLEQCEEPAHIAVETRYHRGVVLLHFGPRLVLVDALVGHLGGELPELLEIVQGKLTLIGFPALVDKVTHCDLEVFDDPNVAARTHRIGLRRLFALQMKDQIKFVEKSIPNLQQMGMQFMAMGTQEELRDQIIAKAIDIACLQDPLPTDAATFNKRKDEGKSRLVLLVNEIARLVSQVLTEFHGLPKRLQGINQQVAAVR